MLVWTCLGYNESGSNGVYVDVVVAVNTVGIKLVVVVREFLFLCM
jgi:hypothetical protein